jgi:hypothetical protein
MHPLQNRCPHVVDDISRISSRQIEHVHFGGSCATGASLLLAEARGAVSVSAPITDTFIVSLVRSITPRGAAGTVAALRVARPGGSAAAAAAAAVPGAAGSTAARRLVPRLTVRGDGAASSSPPESSRIITELSGEAPAAAGMLPSVRSHTSAIREPGLLASKFRKEGHSAWHLGARRAHNRSLAVMQCWLGLTASVPVCPSPPVQQRCDGCRSRRGTRKMRSGEPRERGH